MKSARFEHAAKSGEPRPCWISPTVISVSCLPRRGFDSSDTFQKEEESFSALIDWMHEYGASVDTRLGLGYFDGVRGLVALDDISQGDLLVRCPWRLVIGSSSIDQTDEQYDIIMALRRELERAECSHWRYYLRLFQDMDDRIPALWSPSTLDELQGLPPYDATRHIDWFSQYRLADELSKELDTLTEQALVSYVKRNTEEVGIVPLFDLLNHHNGERNANYRINQFGVEVLASTSISVGNQLFISYGANPTVNVFRDYGFIETWPRNWSWIDDAKHVHSFTQLPADIVAIEPTTEFCADLGRSRMPLFEHQQRARSHTRRCSPVVLNRFEKAAQELLESLPTNASEDARILQHLCDRRQEYRYTNTNWDNQQKDMIDCVRYRMEFKRAIISALNAISAA